MFRPGTTQEKYARRIYRLATRIYMRLKFWVKTGLYRYTPGRYGYYRRLRRYRDPDYIFQRDRHPVRLKHSKKEGWQQANKENKFILRDYSDYEEYLIHQKQKIDEMLKCKGGFNNRVVTEYRLRFFRRFRHLPRLLPHEAVIVCAGARQGTEVEVLRDLGFVNAYGIDLNPGPDNLLVRPGDFMYLQEPSSSLDLLYCNCVDHAFDLEAFFAEHARVIKPNGYALYDFPCHADEAYGLGAFESIAWRRVEDVLVITLRYFAEVVKIEIDSGWKWILLQGKA
jgi:SAM-dependent methyltransferase